MLDLVFDTETTGKWDFKASPWAEHQPAICQIGAILYRDRKVVTELNIVVVPQGIGGARIMIPPEAQRIHGVTEDLVDAVGIPYKVALPMFNQLLKRADRAVAFNTGYDLPVMRTAYNRLAADQAPLNAANWRCAMLSAAPHTKLPGKYGDKWGWPTLDLAYRKLVDPQGFEGAHDAMVDVRAAAAVLFALDDLGAEIVPPKAK